MPTQKPAQKPAPKPAQAQKPAPKSKGKALQENAETSQPDRPIRVTLRTGVGFEYHLTMDESAVRDLLDPDVPDVFIPVPVELPAVKNRYIHTHIIAEVDVHDELSAPRVG
jgi:hypothetical protein